MSEAFIGFLDQEESRSGYGLVDQSLPKQRFFYVTKGTRPAGWTDTIGVQLAAAAAVQIDDEDPH